MSNLFYTDEITTPLRRPRLSTCSTSPEMPISEDEYHLVMSRFIFLEGDKQKNGGGGGWGDDDFGIQSLDKVFTRYHVLQGYK